MGRTVTLVCAPTVPPATCKDLEAHILEAAGDPDYVVVTNYPYYSHVLNYSEGTVNALSAPDVTPSELKALRDNLLKKSFVVVNYDVSVHVLNAELIKASEPDEDDPVVVDAYKRAEAMEDLE
jgi:hypothetical protein